MDIFCQWIFYKLSNYYLVVVQTHDSLVDASKLSALAVSHFNITIIVYNLSSPDIYLNT